MNRLIRFLSLPLLMAALPAAALGDHPAHAPGSTAPVPAEVQVSLQADALATLPREPVSASAHGRTLDCTGIPLVALLRHAQAMPAEPLRGAQLARRVEAIARDGYRVTFSLAELDPTLGNRRVLLVDRCDGKPLDDNDGPLRLIVPEDSRPARWIRQLERLSVLSP